MATIGVVGGGLGGLAAAIRLAAAGQTVHLFEKNAWLGGKMNVLEEKGFVFDRGPTIITMPQVLHRLFEVAGRRTQDYLKLVKLDPQWRAFFEDGQVIDVWGDKEEMIHTLQRVSPKTYKTICDSGFTLSECTKFLSASFFGEASVE